MKNSAYSIFLILAGAWFHPGLSAQSPHDLYDLRPGVERFFESCVPLPNRLCLQDKRFLHEVVMDERRLDGHLYAVLHRRWYENGGFPSPIVDTLYLRVHEEKLFEWSPDGDVLRMDFSVGIGDTLTPNDQGIHRIVADTLARFPDGQVYRILYGISHADSPVTNQTLMDTYLTSVSGIAGWLVPFPNLPTSLLDGYRFFVSRFGFIYSTSVDGLLIIFRSHDGIWYGAPKEHYPVLPTSIDPADPPFEISLLPNYPNPFNPSTQIRWTLDAVRQTRLSVHDLLGREVVVLADGQFGAGTHTAIFDGSGLASGIYLVRLEAGGIVRMIRITLLK